MPVNKLMHKSRGFSLMELAVVLMIIGTLMGGVLTAVTRTTENNRRTNALAQLRQIEQALYGFAQTYGRLPCPATASSGGLELFNGQACTQWYGFVPSNSLGFYGSVNGDGLLLDPWQNPIRYVLSDFEDPAAGSNDYVFNNATQLQSFYNGGASLSPTAMLEVCDDSSCTNTIVNTIPALLLSMGANWATCTSADETENSCETTVDGYSMPNDDRFVVTEYSEDSYDDQLIWISPFILFNKLITAGKLP